MTRDEFKKLFDECFEELKAAQEGQRRSAIFYWASLLGKITTEYTHEVIQDEARNLQIEDESG